MFNNNHIDVYLCVLTLQNTFECKKFDSYEEADNHYSSFYNYNKEMPKSTMLSVCKYTPYFLRQRILNYKLANLFINSKIIDY